MVRKLLASLAVFGLLWTAVPVFANECLSPEKVTEQLGGGAYLELKNGAVTAWGEQFAKLTGMEIDRTEWSVIHVYPLDPETVLVTVFDKKGCLLTYGAIPARVFELARQRSQAKD